MNKLLEHLKQNNYEYTIENDIRACMYVLTIRKNGKGIIRHYPYNIDNLVNPDYMIEDIESEFNE